MVYTKNLKPGMLLIYMCSGRQRVYVIKKDKVICYLGYIEPGSTKLKDSSRPTNYPLACNCYEFLRVLSVVEAAIFKLEWGA